MTQVTSSSFAEAPAARVGAVVRSGSVPERAGHVAAIIPRGEVIRNFVHSGAFDKVYESADLSLISVSPGGSLEEIMGRKYGEEYPLEELPERWPVRFQREILDVAHGRWLWSEAAKQRWRLRDSEAVTMKQKLSRSAKKLIGVPFASRSGLRVLSGIERASSRLLRTSDQYLELYRRIEPTLVFNGSHIHSRNAIQAVQAAQWLGIPTATFVFSWDNLTSQGRITLPYDHYLVWNEAIKEQLLEIYEWIRPEQVVVTGTPQFDFHFRPEFRMSRRDFCESVGADAERPLVLYSTGMANHMPAEPEIVEEIADMLAGPEFEGRPQLLVRVYPKDRTGRFEELKKRRPDILFPEIAWEPDWLTPKAEDSEALVNTLLHCEAGINVASTISLELCMFDKPAINVGYNPASVDERDLSYSNYYNFDHYRPIVESGAIEVAYSREEMKQMLRKALDEPEARKEERKALISRMFGDTLDGRSAERVADALTAIASGSVGQ